MNYISADFRIQHLSYYKLVIQAGHQEDVLMIMDQENAVQAYIRYASASPSVDATRLLALPFRHVSIMIPQHSLTFVPAEAYQEEDEDIYGEYLVNKNDQDIYTVDMPRFQLHAIYQLDSLLYQRWYTLFPDATYLPIFQVLFDLVPEDVPSVDTQLFLHEQAGHMHVMLLKEGRFLFYNSFYVTNAADLGYYVRRIMSDFSVPSLDEIQLFNLEKNDPLLAFVQKFSAQLVRVKLPEADVDHHAVHQSAPLFGTLFQRELCV
ncbi:DUF3822 family protein [Sphingobacterium sp. lm-10]|uniref:DUF3822 family protein n=1 Tax=Sphingobacterium sp. lm-10 TaxID=2944904 RepID=UPI0020216483|nr:DUF3822 family protein [Sphingobacterium sp. lm-10]MCL7986775.1 DUF3822 family protein [Sphingobacterium sp. lm-10]